MFLLKDFYDTITKFTFFFFFNEISLPKGKRFQNPGASFQRALFVRMGILAAPGASYAHHRSFPPLPPLHKGEAAHRQHERRK